MSNNLYDILAKFNAVDQQQQPTQQPKAKTKLAENIETVEGQLNEKYMGFKKTVAAVKKGGSADNPEAVAAAIGRKKYGKEKFQKAAAQGKKLGEQQNVAENRENVRNQVMRTASEWLRDPRLEAQVVSLMTTGINVTDPAKGFEGDDGNDREYPGKYQFLLTTTAKNPMYFKDFLNMVIRMKKDPRAEVIGRVQAEQPELAEEQQDESALQAYLGKKKYGEEGMKALQQAGRDGASKETMAKIRAKHDKMDEEYSVGMSDQRAAKLILDKIQGLPMRNIQDIERNVTRYLDMVGKAPTDVKHLSVLIYTDLQNMGLMETMAKMGSKEKKVKEGAMPASVIKIKEKIRHMSDADKRDYFKGKTKDELKAMARRHGYGQDSNVYSKYASDKVNEDQRAKPAATTSLAPTASTRPAIPTAQSGDEQPGILRRAVRAVGNYINQMDQTRDEHMGIKRGEYPDDDINKGNPYYGTKTNEVAPPGAKAERMVKHIKKGYARDGKLSDKERSIAYATAWKAHKAGKVEEAVAALQILARSGMTAQQITEGWEDMMKAVAQRAKDEQGTGKFDKKKDPTTGGTVYTRKYNPKTGETDDTENVTAVKRGRGRPKKSAFEQYMQKYEAMLEDADPLGKFIKGLDQKGASAKTAPAPAPAPAMGTIKNGVWTADAPKPGEKGVPVPVPVDEAGKGPTVQAALGNDPSNPLNNKMGGYQEFMPKPGAKPAPTGPDQSSAETARLARYAQQAAQSKAAVTPSSAVPQKPVEGPGGAAFGIYPKAFPNRQAPVKPSSGMSAADFQRTDKDTTPVPMPTKPAAAKPAAEKPAPQRVTTTYTGPEGDAGEAQAQAYQAGNKEAQAYYRDQADRAAAAAAATASAQTGSARTEPQAAPAAPTAEPKKPAGIPGPEDQPTVWRDGSGNPARDSQGNIWKPGFDQPTAQQRADAKAKLTPSQLKWLGGADPTDPFIQMRMPKPKAGETPATPTAPAASSAEPAATNFTPDASQTVVEKDMELEEMMRLAGMGEALKGGQKKLDKNKNGRLDADDFARLRGEVDEDFALLVPPPSAARSADQAKAIGALKPAEPGKPDPFAKGAVAVPLSDLPKREISGMEEGNEFSGALDAARDAGKSEFEVDGKTYPVKGKMDEGHETCTECGYAMTECGCDAGHEESHEGHMNVSMNADSDGNQSMTVSADGEDAVKLAQLLKLAGLSSGQPEAVYHPVEVVVGDEEEEIEEEKDPRYHASTTPDEEVFGIDTQIKGGNGDVAGQEKKMMPHGYQFGDNPIAMKETVARDYESIKVRK